jgi:ketosteroid isomerase-like protein
MKLNRLIYLATGSMLLSGCMQAAVDIDAERAALQAAVDAYHAAGSAADTAAVTALYSSDAVTLPPNEAAVIGPEAMGEFAQAFTAASGFSMRFENVSIGVGAGGDMGYSLADTIVTVDGPNGQPVTETLRDFHLWKKEGGAWKVAIDIWNMEAPPAGAASNPLEGAWLSTSVTDPDGNLNDDPQPALHVFTPTHYSMMIATGNEPRAGYEGETMTDAETLAAYETIIANTGRYEIDGNILKTRAYVAKDPNYMGDWPENEVTFEFMIDGDTLTLTNQGFGAGTVTTLRQVEGTPNPW